MFKIPRSFHSRASQAVKAGLLTTISLLIQLGEKNPTTSAPPYATANSPRQMSNTCAPGPVGPPVPITARMHSTPQIHT
eukprot:5954807-Pyramimonas_sp.AAC.1